MFLCKNLPQPKATMPEPYESVGSVDETTEDNVEIFSYSPNPESAAPTIVFIHGIISSHLEFSLVYPHLQEDYHILLLDLPGHSRSAHIPGPYTYTSAAQHVQNIINKHAHNGQAHVVGVSLGGFVGLQLTASAPERVMSVFVSGSAPFQRGARFVAGQPWLIYAAIYTMTRLIPGWLYDKICDWSGMQRHREFRKEMARNTRYGLIRDFFTSLLNCSTEMIAEIGETGRRVLAVAGGQGDDVTATKKMGVTLIDAGSLHSQAAVVKKAVHAWDVQFPELFAAGVKAWIEEKDLPAEFEKL